MGSEGPELRQEGCAKRFRARRFFSGSMTCTRERERGGCGGDFGKDVMLGQGRKMRVERLNGRDSSHPPNRSMG